MLTFRSNLAQTAITDNLLWVTETLAITQLLLIDMTRGYLNIPLKMKRPWSNEGKKHKKVF